MVMTNFPGGLSASGVPVLGSGSLVTTGNVFFVDSGAGSDNNVGDEKDAPLATLDYAVSQCTASNGDIVVLMPGHAETTTAIGLDVAGVKVVGLGVGASRPTLTATTAATDLINVSADDCWLENVRLVGAASGVTAIIDVGADDFTLYNAQIETGAAPVDIITVSAGARGHIYDCYFLGTAAGPDNAILFEIGSSDATNWHVKGCMFNYLEFDIDENIIDCPDKSAVGLVVEDCRMLGLAAQAITIKSSIANKFAFIENCTLVAHAAAATIANLLGATRVGLFVGRNVYGTDTTNTERAGPIPTTTPA